jgi:hypothetical protein
MRLLVDVLDINLLLKKLENFIVSYNGNLAPLTAGAVSSKGLFIQTSSLVIIFLMLPH